MFLRLFGPYPVLRIRSVSFYMACRVRNCHKHAGFKIAHLINTRVCVAGKVTSGAENVLRSALFHEIGTLQYPTRSRQKLL
jgi:hypothetical protein